LFLVEPVRQNLWLGDGATEGAFHADRYEDHFDVTMDRASGCRESGVQNIHRATKPADSDDAAAQAEHEFRFTV
jgi:hypothetical protein